MIERPMTTWQLPRLLLEVAPETAPAIAKAQRSSGWVDE